MSKTTPWCAPARISVPVLVPSLSKLHSISMIGIGTHGE